ncbi:MAG TPA: hypothetical protein VJ044_01520, partial [Candidatus Hodarchaeales archaeon]|nr:hypothetical protein [Candidatus Hodarchaeales archaeon]
LAGSLLEIMGCSVDQVKTLTGGTMTYPKRHDEESEKDQIFTDWVNKIYSESLKPANITQATIKEAIVWAYGRNELKEISESTTGDDAYLGSLVGGVIRDYLFHRAEKEAEGE